MEFSGRNNYNESVKTQEKEVNSKHTQNYRADHGKFGKTQEKELDSKRKQNYRANRDESVETHEKEAHSKHICRTTDLSMINLLKIRRNSWTYESWKERGKLKKYAKLQS